MKNELKPRICGSTLVDVEQFVVDLIDAIAFIAENLGLNVAQGKKP